MRSSALAPAASMATRIDPADVPTRASKSRTSSPVSSWRAWMAPTIQAAPRTPSLPHPLELDPQVDSSLPLRQVARLHRCGYVPGHLEATIRARPLAGTTQSIKDGSATRGKSSSDNSRSCGNPQLQILASEHLCGECDECDSEQKRGQHRPQHGGVLAGCERRGLRGESRR